jgi:hypothetical protein
MAKKDSRDQGLELNTEGFFYPRMRDILRVVSVIKPKMKFNRVIGMPKALLKTLENNHLNP